MPVAVPLSDHPKMNLKMNPKMNPSLSDSPSQASQTSPPKWHKVICPKFSKPNAPVTISVTAKGQQEQYLTISLSAALAARIGAVKGGEACLYLSPDGKLLRMVLEGGPDARTLVMIGGHRVSLIYRYRPFGNVLPKKLCSTAVTAVSAKPGELIIELPAKASPSKA